MLYTFCLLLECFILSVKDALNLHISYAFRRRMCTIKADDRERIDANATLIVNGEENKLIHFKIMEGPKAVDKQKILTRGRRLFIVSYHLFSPVSCII